MKTRIAIITMLLGVFIAGTAFAGEPEPAAAMKIAATNAVAEFLQDEIDYPAFASETNKECTVYVDLTIKEDGSLSVNQASAKHGCLKEHVVEAIKEAKDKDLAKYAGQEVVLKIDFRLLD